MKSWVESRKLFLLAAVFVMFFAAQFFGFQYTHSVEEEDYHIRLQV